MQQRSNGGGYGALDALRWHGSGKRESKTLRETAGRLVVKVYIACSKAVHLQTRKSRGPPGEEGIQKLNFCRWTFHTSMCQWRSVHFAPHAYQPSHWPVSQNTRPRLQVCNCVSSSPTRCLTLEAQSELLSDSSLKAPSVAIITAPWHSHGQDVCLGAVGGARDALQRTACHVTAPAVATLELAPCSLQARQH